MPIVLDHFPRDKNDTSSKKERDYAWPNKMMPQGMSTSVPHAISVR
jgi:hypothetical protein